MSDFQENMFAQNDSSGLTTTAYSSNYGDGGQYQSPPHTQASMYSPTCTYEGSFIFGKEESKQIGTFSENATNLSCDVISQRQKVPDDTTMSFEGSFQSFPDVESRFTSQTTANSTKSFPTHGSYTSPHDIFAPSSSPLSDLDTKIMSFSSPHSVGDPSSLYCRMASYQHYDTPFLESRHLPHFDVSRGNPDLQLSPGFLRESGVYSSAHLRHHGSMTLPLQRTPEG